jgi:hypothetical protein
MTFFIHLVILTDAVVWANFGLEKLMAISIEELIVHLSNVTDWISNQAGVFGDFGVKLVHFFLADV